jgi:hypothetical protein
MHALAQPRSDIASKKTPHIYMIIHETIPARSSGLCRFKSGFHAHLIRTGSNHRNGRASFLSISISISRLEESIRILQDLKINLDFDRRNRHSRTDAVEIAVLDTLSISISISIRKIDVVEQMPLKSRARYFVDFNLDFDQEIDIVEQMLLSITVEIAVLDTLSISISKIDIVEHYLNVA